MKLEMLPSKEILFSWSFTNSCDDVFFWSDNITTPNAVTLTTSYVVSADSGAKWNFSSPIGAVVHTSAYDDLMAEIARLRLTDDERWAISVLMPLLLRRTRSQTC